MGALQSYQVITFGEATIRQSQWCAFNIQFFRIFPLFFMSYIIGVVLFGTSIYFSFSQRQHLSRPLWPRDWYWYGCSMGNIYEISLAHILRCICDIWNISSSFHNPFCSAHGNLMHRIAMCSTACGEKVMHTWKPFNELISMKTNATIGDNRNGDDDDDVTNWSERQTHKDKNEIKIYR